MFMSNGSRFLSGQGTFGPNREWFQAHSIVLCMPYPAATEAMQMLSQRRHVKGYQGKVRVTRVFVGMGFPRRHLHNQAGAGCKRALFDLNVAGTAEEVKHVSIAVPVGEKPATRRNPDEHRLYSLCQQYLAKDAVGQVGTQRLPFQ